MDCAGLLDAIGGPQLPRGVLRAFDYLSGLAEINRACDAAGLRAGMPAETVASSLLRQLNISICISWEKPPTAELGRGPLVVVANHPFGFADAFALTTIVGTIRDDWRAIANTFLGAARLDGKRLLFVDLFGKARHALNRASLRAALQHLEGGGSLAVFPSTFCSHFDVRKRMIVDRPWSEHIRQLVAHTKATVLPVYFHGSNSALFAAAGFIPSVRTALLGRELLRRKNSRLDVRVGAPLPWSQLSRVSKTAMTEYMRANVYALKFAMPRREGTESNGSSQVVVKSQECDTALLSEFERLKETHLVASTGNLSVLLLKPSDSSQFFSTLCGVHAKAGFSYDRYDEENHHLIGWDTGRKQIFGTYRLRIPSPERAVDLRDYASAQSFRFEAGAMPLLQEGIELGRACIAPGYQREYAPLLALWFGILGVWLDNDRYRYLFGPAWMQRSYHSKSIALITRYLSQRCADVQFAAHLEPKHRVLPERFGEFDADRIITGVDDFRAIDRLVHAIEGGRQGLPTLFKRYLDVGARFAGFARWRELGDVVVGLAILDKARASHVYDAFASRFKRRARVETVS